MEKIIRLTESDINKLVKKILNEGIPPALMKLFGAQTARKLEQVFEPKVAENIEKYFAHIIAIEEKNLLTKAGQQYLKSSIGVEIPATTIKSILDMGLAGKINKGNMEQYLQYLPEKLFNGNEFRDNIRTLLTATINKVEKTGAQKAAGQAEVKATTQKVATNQSSQAAPVGQALSKGSFGMSDAEESKRLAYWFDQKFYEANNKRHAFITDEVINKMTPETKSYLLNLLEKTKNIHPDFRGGRFLNPENNKVMTTENDLLKMVTSNMWGGYGRPGIMASKAIYKEAGIPSLPIPSKSVENNLNSIFPTSSNTSYAHAGKNAWSSSN